MAADGWGASGTPAESGSRIACAADPREMAIEPDFRSRQDDHGPKQVSHRAGADNEDAAGVPYILANEAAERFAFYGMSSILVVFMTQNLLGPGGVLKVMADESARAWFHWFTAAVYFMAIVGAVISDLWLGKFKTIIWFALVYCIGFFVLALDHTRLGLAAGLILIATGAGIIKPCVSANVGDQFGPSNKHLIQKVYSWFYFSINVGAAVSMWLCPILLDKLWSGRRLRRSGRARWSSPRSPTGWGGARWWTFHRPAPRPGVEMFDREQSISLAKIGIIFLFASMFFALYLSVPVRLGAPGGEDGTAVAGHRRGCRPSRRRPIPCLIVVMIPLFAYVVYPAINEVLVPDPASQDGDRHVRHGRELSGPDLDRDADPAGRPALHRLAVRRPTSS